ncbi:MAG: efflux RND transporter permease subunit, partial [Succinivibrio sp.]
MISEFFIRRPVFAWVIALSMMLAGVLCINNMSIAQYPDVAPPQVSISATYPGASAESLENSVTQVIEQQLTGLDGLLYFSSSSSSSSGQVSITVTFAQGTDPDMAQVQVKNKVSQAESRLPTEVTQQGVTVSKSQSDFLLVMCVYDATDRHSAGDISDYLVSNMQDELSRIEGVGDVQVFGAQHAMRIWLDPVKLASYSLMPSDVKSAIQAQNTQVSSGQIGASPSSKDQQLVATIKSRDRLQTPKQFGDIILKSSTNGAIVRIRDVARVEIGSENYTSDVMANGHPASAIGFKLAAGANALDTAELIKARIAEFQKHMPDGYTVSYPMDSTDFIKISISEVVDTLFEALLLVILVMYVFLQNLRSTIIPAISVPVVLLGSFAILYACGFTINTLTMFGMVLAIGLLVDDTIVVVENVERLLHEEHLNPVDASIKSMRELTGTLFGVAVVLSAVFLPMAFFSGSTGVIYRQFSITIVSAMMLSAFVAITLTPALCATILKPVQPRALPSGDSLRGRTLGKLLGAFNRGYDKVHEKYTAVVDKGLKKPVILTLVYALCVIGSYFVYTTLPTGFLPTEDQGYIMVQYTLPAGASTNRTQEVREEIQKYFDEHEKKNINVAMIVDGFSFSGTGQNAGMGFVSLKNWDERTSPEDSSTAIANRAMRALSQIRDAQVYALTPPAISGLGNSNGFTFELQGLAGLGRDKLKQYRDQLIAKAAQDPSLMSVRPNTLPDMPQLKVDINDDKARSLGLSLTDINNTLSYAFGGTYVNDFIDGGRVKKVYMQGSMQYRSKPEDLFRWQVKGTNSSGEAVMAPFSSFSSYHWEYGADTLSRYNGLESYEIQGQQAPGKSSGDAMNAMERLASALPSDTTFSWTSLSYQEKLSSGGALKLYAISLLVVFLCLAALYESWSIPISVLLVIPLGLVGALAAVQLRGLENDIYFQVALITVIGLSAKNAILIVEFAEARVKQGESLLQAAVHAASLRFRPILMTSFAFMAGVFPLAVASGAGANSRVAIGTGII